MKTQIIKFQIIRRADGYYIFDVTTPNNHISDIEFSLPGKHNMMNALSCYSNGRFLWNFSSSIKKSLKSFKGVERRFSYKIKTDDTYFNR